MKTPFAKAPSIFVLSLPLLLLGCTPSAPVEESYVYEVTPSEGTKVDFHTEMQKQFLLGEEIDPPSSILGNPIDGNPFDSKDFATKKRMHEDWSIPNPVSLDWKGEEAETYYIELSTESSFKDASLIQSFETKETHLDVYNLYIGTQYYWRIAPSKEKIAKGKVYSFETEEYGPRNIYIDGVTNVRDLGGFPTSNGGKMRQGLLYRGGRLNLSNIDDDVSVFQNDPSFFRLDITEEGLDTLVNDLGVKTEVDIRVASNNEIGNMDDSRIEGVDYVGLPMDYQGGSGNNFTRLNNPKRIKSFFELLSDEDNLPLYFHCNIGTDRTGCLAYLVGALCGMDETDLYKNYTFSNFGNIAGSTSAAGRSYTSLTSSSGYATTVNGYPGETLSEKAENALVDICGLSHDLLNVVRDNLVEGGEAFPVIDD